jgi:anti-anti-sigma factor
VLTDHRASHTVLKVHGEIDIHTVAPLRQAVGALDGASHGRVVVDFEEVGFFGATGLNTLVAAHARCRAAGGRLEVRTSQSRARRLFRLTGLGYLLEAPLQPSASS